MSACEDYRLQCGRGAGARRLTSWATGCVTSAGGGVQSAQADFSMVQPPVSTGGWGGVQPTLANRARQYTTRSFVAERMMSAAAAAAATARKVRLASVRRVRTVRMSERGMDTR